MPARTGLDVQPSLIRQALQRVAKRLRARLGDSPSPAELDIPAALGASDADLARLDLDRESTAETLRAAALATHAGMSLLR
jgi:hypothetical protein